MKIEMLLLAAEIITLVISGVILISQKRTAENFRKRLTTAISVALLSGIFGVMAWQEHMKMRAIIPFAVAGFWTIWSIRYWVTGGDED